MYQIDELIDNRYKYIQESENILEIDKIVFKLTLKQIPCRILKDDILLIFLNGTAYQYKYWKDNYVRENKKVSKLERIRKR